MPDLSHQAALKFWSQYENPNIYRVIAFMEGVEQWTVDGNPQLEEVLTQLGKELDNATNIEDFDQYELLINVISQIRTSRGLRLMQIMDSLNPGSASRLLMYAEEHDQGTDSPAGLFLRRNIVFERLRLLSRTFSKERMSIILQALGGEST